ncbi:Calcineurin-like phosphoesterase [Posidoniimonas polymericola]|uniref:Calcineurin-like phosphoesterase n=1 Tax=Posidoniimonas polymericola TaxID=2528002 RepID=A0A5C5YMA5_9BACT|nr:LamG-like jellyroll fold domain-containing protein [Posidoniimonas polymericola]TWT76042.1 Calcineurin-like phosphoesterase [Posidoniimonas polymericola]
MLRTTLACALAVGASLAALPASAHKGPDPLARWVFNNDAVNGRTCKAVIGPDARIEGGAEVVADGLGESLHFSGRGSMVVVADDLLAVKDKLPSRAMTVSAWVSIEKPQEFGGLFGVLQDNGGAETGWLLGYDREHFYFALATDGADDGDGQMTYLRGSARHERGRWAHVVAVYDGETMELYVNGELDGSSDAQSGDILYPEHAAVTIGGYRDDNENYPHAGSVREVAVYDSAATGAWVEHEFSHRKNLVALRPERTRPPGRADAFNFLVRPYLQYGTKHEMTVMCQTTTPGTTVVHYGPTADCELSESSDNLNEIQEVTLSGLDPETQYFYRVESQSDTGETVLSDVSTFATAVNDDTPFAFAVFGDTQWNAVVAARVASHAWAQRPSFLLHAGDLVDTGTNDSHWTQHFFPSMHELISRVPLFPVLGNHEQDAENYYQYMSLPDPEHYYSFRYGCAEFFMIDSNRNVGADSEQYAWLDRQLDQSTAKWKIVCHHHPPYSSDENDYGDLWKTNQSTRGAERVRPLTQLYDAHGVDIVWNGHIHSYERTWPVRDGKAVEAGAGPVYMITGGAGGGLETPAPTRSFFQNVVRRGHHYVMVHVNGDTLEMRSFDIDDRMFDTLTIQKPTAKTAD